MSGITQRQLLSDADKFELLLKNKSLRENKVEQIESRINHNINYTKADKGATFDDFISMVYKIVAKTMKKDEVQFKVDDGFGDIFNPSKKIEHPYIFYNLISRVPRRMEPKPKFRENIEDRNPDGSIARLGAIYAQVFDTTVQFNIVASDYSKANKVMNAFEDAMLTYSGYFKRNGVGDLFFEKQYTDSNLDVYRQNLSIRSLVYRVSIEKIWTVFDTIISEINQSKKDT